MKIIILLIACCYSFSLYAFSPTTPEYHQVKTIIREATLFQNMASINELSSLDESSLDWSESEWNNFLNKFLTTESKLQFHDKNLGKPVREFIRKQYTQIRTLGREHGVGIVVAAIIIEIFSWTAPPVLVAIGLPQLAALMFVIPQFPLLMGGVLLFKSAYKYIGMVRLYGGFAVYHYYAQLHRVVLQDLHLKKNKGYIVKFPHIDSGFVLMPDKFIHKKGQINKKSLAEFLTQNILMTETYNSILQSNHFTIDEKIIQIAYDLSLNKKTLELFKNYFKDQWLENLNEVDQNNEIQKWAESTILDLTRVNNIASSFDSLIVNRQQTIYYFRIYNQFILPQYTKKTPGNQVKTFHALHKRFTPFLVNSDKNPKQVWNDELQLKMDEYFAGSFSLMK